MIFLTLPACALLLAGFEAFFHLKASLPQQPNEISRMLGGPAAFAADEPLVRSLNGDRIYGIPARPKDRILCLGDSFAYSYGVPYTQSLAFFLQRQLNGGRYFGGKRVYNLGAPATGLLTHKKIYETVGGKLPHAIVLLVSGWNTIGRTYGEKQNGDAEAVCRESGSALAHSALGRELLNEKSLRRQTSIPEADKSSPEVWREAESDYAEGFRGLVAEIKANHATPVVVMVDCTQVTRAFVKKLSAENSVPYYQQDFACGSADCHCRNYDGHFNAKGNRELAESLHRFLASRSLLEPSASAEREQALEETDR